MLKCRAVAACHIPLTQSTCNVWHNRKWLIVARVKQATTATTTANCVKFWPQASRNTLQHFLALATNLRVRVDKPPPLAISQERAEALKHLAKQRRREGGRGGEDHYLFLSLSHIPVTCRFDLWLFFGQLLWPLATWAATQRYLIAAAQLTEAATKAANADFDKLKQNKNSLKTMDWIFSS